MSDKNLARRASAEVAFDGVDITSSITPYLLSLTYTDSEEDEADDLQLKFHDREDIWLEKWLETMINASAASPRRSSSSTRTTSGGNLYRVNAKGGVNVRAGPNTSYYKFGTLVYDTVVEVVGSKNKWLEIVYNGKTAYVHSNYLDAVKSSTGYSSGSGDGWNIGDAVIATGRPQYTSYGTKPGQKVTNYEGTITHLNLRDGVPYPIHVSHLGWFAISEVKKLDTSGNSTEPITATGFKIQAVIAARNWDGNGNDKLLDCGQFELESVQASGPPAVIQVRATALPFTSQIRQTKKTKAWEAYSLSGIAKEMAKKSGMACMYLADKDPQYSRVEQYATSDISFLSRLCHEAGLSLKVANNILVLFNQASYEAADAVLTIKKGDKSYTKWNLKTGEAKKHYASCRVRWTTSSGKLIEGIARVEDYDAEDESNQQLEIRAKVNSKSQAETLATKYLRLHNKYQKTASFTMPGNPLLGSGMTVQLEGWGAWNGKYIVSQAKHCLGNSYTTQLELRRALEGY